MDWKPRPRRLSRPRLFGVAVSVLLAFSCSPAPDPPAPPDAWENDLPYYADEQAFIDETFRVDIAAIDVVLTYDPRQAVVDGEARVRFRMRPGQTRPRLHFDPACRGNVISQWRLDGMPFEPPRDAYRVVSVPGSSQPLLEFVEEVDPHVEHELAVSYRLRLDSGYPRFSTAVNDLQGSGNEKLFPTLNAPHELARHRITLRVAGDVPYRCLGSGRVEPLPGAPLQEWLLDTERDVASYTVMFVLVPEADTVLRQGLIAGVPVRLAAYEGGADVDAAWDELSAWLPQLIADIGPFPMPRGLSVFLVSAGGGMEYYGGTISSLSALSHEVFHMYFACSAVARTYRDSWLDEAITSWYDRTYPAYLVPIEADFRSNMVSGRSPVAVGFDDRAYTQGTQIIESLARRLPGQRASLIAFLAYVHQRAAFAPFDTMDFARFFLDYTGLDVSREFRSWLYSGDAAGAAGGAAAGGKEPPDLTPPAAVQRRHGGA